MTDALAHAIEQLYAVFAAYSATDLSGSPLYVDREAWNRALCSRRLRQLSEDDLARFVHKAITTWGSVNDLKHFLPRILELTARPHALYDVWVTFEKLELAGFSTWPQGERVVVHAYRLALWDAMLSGRQAWPQDEFEDYFFALAHFHTRFDELMDRWGRLASGAAVAHLVDLLLAEQTAIFRRGKFRGLYSKTDNVDAFVKWVLSDAIIARLEECYFHFEMKDFSERISWAVQLLEGERNSQSAT